MEQELSGPSNRTVTAVDDHTSIEAEGPPAGPISSTTSQSTGNRVEQELSGPSNYSMTAVNDPTRIEAQGPPAAVDQRTARLSAVSSHRQVTLASICVPNH